MIDGLLNPPWPVLFGVLLSVVLFFGKFGIGRSLEPDDIIVGISDIPSVLTASACSLLVSAMIKSTASNHNGLLFLLILIAIFVFNVCVLRFVEKRRRALKSNWIVVSLLVAFSFSFSLLVSFNVVSTYYAGLSE
jgi:phosphatidylserine synthase